MVVVVDITTVFPQEGDQYIMKVLICLGYSREMLLWLNRVQAFLQLLFSDILTVFEHKISPEILSRQLPGEAWLNMRWPNEQPTDLDFHLWRNAMSSICPS